ncbi:MAG: hypothetical protein N2645_15560 [Clostridia bacterium]|nr:hypothetical protein [Clostridia bacterium]
MSTKNKDQGVIYSKEVDSGYAKQYLSDGTTEYVHCYGQLHNHTVQPHLIKSCITCNKINSKDYLSKDCTDLIDKPKRFHSHGCPIMAYRHARDKAKLDFLAITDHSTAFNEHVWKNINKISDHKELYVKDKFVPIAGFEMTFAQYFVGHLNTFNTEGYCKREQFNKKYAMSRDATEVYEMSEDGKKILEFSYDADTNKFAKIELTQKELAIRKIGELRGKSNRKEIDKLKKQFIQLSQNDMNTILVDEIDNKIYEILEMMRVEKDKSKQENLRNKLVELKRIILDKELEDFKEILTKEILYNKRVISANDKRSVKKILNNAQATKINKISKLLKNNSIGENSLEAKLLEYEKNRQLNRESIEDKFYQIGLLCLADYYDWISEQNDSITQLNHIGNVGAGILFNSAFYAKARDSVHLAEIANGDYDEMSKVRYYFENYNRALQNGWRVAPTFGQDNHDGKWGTRNSLRTVILLPFKKEDFLTREAVYNAMRARHVYAVDGLECQLEFKLLFAKMKNSNKPVELNAIMGDDISKDIGENSENLESITAYVKVFNEQLFYCTVKIIADNEYVEPVLGKRNRDLGLKPIKTIPLLNRKGYVFKFKKEDLVNKNGELYTYIYIVSDLYGGAPPFFETEPPFFGTAISAPIWLNYKH